MGTDQKIEICHLISGDLWAGAEVQMFTMVAGLNKDAEYNIRVILLNNGKLANKLREAGIETLVFDENRYRFFAILRHMAKYLEDKKVDILHTHRYKENILGALIKRRCKVKSLVQTVHGIVEKHKGIKRLKIGSYAILNNYFTKNYFERIIAVSNNIKKQLCGQFSARQLVTIHNCIDIESIKINHSSSTIRQRFGFAQDEIVIGSAGRMVPVKGYDIFLEAAHVILQRRPTARFLIAGDGPLMAELELKTRQLDIADKVVFPGFCDDIIDVTNCLDIFVLSSHHEGVPMALLEAMVLKKAIVATSVGGITEVIESGLSGLLVEAGNPQKLAEACIAIIENPALKHRLEIGAVQRVADHFSSQRQVESIAGLYKELISNR